ncbi:bacteriocin [Flavobacteriaceae bacterium R38]|nr:bacteriocin [Flavobacteriaceae bacterium R38]
MLKSILKLNGVKELEKKELKKISGGGFGCDPIDGGGGSGGSGGGNGGGPTCFCLIPGFSPTGFIVDIVPCDSTCPDGTDPFST